MQGVRLRKLKGSPRGGPVQFSSLSLHRRFPFSIPPLPQLFPGWWRRGAAGVGRVLPAAWQALPVRLPGFSGLTLAFQRLEVQSRRRAALAASLFPNIERQREKSLLLPAHQSTTTVDTGQALLKITVVLPDTRASRGQRGTIHPGAAGMERSWAGEKLGVFSSIPPLNKESCLCCPSSASQ